MKRLIKLIIISLLFVKCTFMISCRTNDSRLSENEITLIANSEAYLNYKIAINNSLQLHGLDLYELEKIVKEFTSNSNVDPNQFKNVKRGIEYYFMDSSVLAVINELNKKIPLYQNLSADEKNKIELYFFKHVKPDLSAE